MRMKNKKNFNIICGLKAEIKKVKNEYLKMNIFRRPKPF